MWNSKDKNSNVEALLVGDACLKLNYIGPGKRDEDSGSTRANHPAPPSAGIFYYEVTILSRGKDGYIGIGFCSAAAILSALPGWHGGSFGYHGDDGCIFRQAAIGTSYGPKFTSVDGDVVGCGINFYSNTIFYTYNGAFVGVAVSDLAVKELYPVVGLRSKGESIQANFGQAEFVFDFRGFVKEEKKKAMGDIANLPVFSATETHAMVSRVILSYLVQQGYLQTAMRFAQDAGIAHSFDATTADIEHRRAVRGLLLRGEVSAATATIEASHPALLARFPQLVFALYCQAFVELVRESKIAEAMKFGKSHLSVYCKDARFDQQQLVTTFSLLAYPNPRQSPGGCLLDDSRREALADYVNTVLFKSREIQTNNNNNNSSSSNSSSNGNVSVDVVVQQTAVILNELKFGQSGSSSSGGGGSGGHLTGPAALVTITDFFINK